MYYEIGCQGSWPPPRTPYALQQLMMGHLDQPDIAEGTKKLAARHGFSSNAMKCLCLSYCTTIDIQDVMMKVHECKSLIVGHGLQKIAPGLLKGFSDLPTSAHQEVKDSDVMHKH